MKKSLLASTLIAATALAVPTFADTDTWTGSTDSNWSTPGNWDNGWTDGDDATFTSSATNQTVTVDGKYTLGELIISGGSYTFDYTDDESSLTVTNSTIGGAGGALLKITGGTNSFGTRTGPDLIIGSSSGSGTLEISGGTNTFSGSGFSVNVGTKGTTGALTITGGSSTFSGNSVDVGANGTLTIGTSGGGIDDVKTAFSCYVYVGGDGDNGEVASVVIYSGTNSFSGTSTQIGHNGTGSLTIYGGKNTLSSNVYVGNDSKGTLTIYDGTNMFSTNLRIGYTEGGDGTLTIIGGKNTFSRLYIGEGSGAKGKVKITGGDNAFESGPIYIGEVSGGEGSIEISGGTTEFWNDTTYISYASGSSGSLTITGGTNQFTSSAKVYVGYGDSGTFTISGGTTTFGSNTSIYVGNGASAIGTFTISGGTTTISGTTTIANGSSLSIGGGESLANVNLNKQIGTSATGTVEISNNANIVISGSLLTSLEATIDEDGDRVAIITANTIIFDTLELTSEFTGEDDLDSVINQYISAGDYLLTWTWDTSDSTLYASVAGTISVPEPGMFSVFFGIGALGLIATRRRRRKA